MYTCTPIACPTGIHTLSLASTPARARPATAHTGWKCQHACCYADAACALDEVPRTATHQRWHAIMHALLLVRTCVPKARRAKMRVPCTNEHASTECRLRTAHGTRHAGSDSAHCICGGGGGGTRSTPASGSCARGLTAHVSLVRGERRQDAVHGRRWRGCVLWPAGVDWRFANSQPFILVILCSCTKYTGKCCNRQHCTAREWVL